MDDKRVSEVIVSTDRNTLDERSKMGWDITSYLKNEKCRIIINPTDQEMDTLLSEEREDSWHLFSGIRAFPWVFKVFKKSLRYKLNRAIIQERPNTFAFGCANGKPIWLHKIRFFLMDRKYAKYVNCVFAMGTEAVNYFKSVYTWKVYPFCYCTESFNISISNISSDSPLRICYVGSLVWWKNVCSLLRAINILRENHQSEVQVTIIGDGPQKNKMMKYVKEKNMPVLFVGVKPNSEIPAIMGENDVFVLPSIYDGWGAVVNEALLCGLFTICSDAAGASQAVSLPQIGRVFHSKDTNQLAACIQYCVMNKTNLRYGRQQRKEWAEKHLGGKAVARYLVDTLLGANPKCPWISS